MGFFRDKAVEMKAAIDSGDMERAADAIIYAMREGGSDRAETLAKMTDELLREQGRS
ncbi:MULTISPECIES: hypothetical protein [Actinomycetes]|uniref:Uncharacterized protein n=1 Tax=Luedemannella helvata TaxID=349315 RepID=A0ABP4XIB2_9ACTN|nr:hypothetical protein [Streptomyces virginiae]